MAWRERAARMKVGNSLKVAITKGNLRIPPTYFAVSHAQHMKAEHEFRFFTLNAHIEDGATSIPVEQAIPFEKFLSFEQRNHLLPFFERSLGRRIAKFEPAVIHQHFGTWATAAVTASRTSGIPLLTTVHGADVHLMTSGLSSPMARANRRSVVSAFAQSSKVLAVSKYLAGLAVGAGADASKLEIHYQGIDTDYFVPTDSLRSSDEPTVLFVGNHSIAKGARDVFQASVQAQTTSPHRLLMVGGGPLVDELRNESAQHRHIEVLGPKPREEILPLLQGATVFMSASQLFKGWTEAAGLVNLEAQACGVPVVGYANGGIPEMVSPQASTLVEEGNTHQLGNALSEFLQLDSQSSAALRQSARQFAVSERSLEASCRQLNDLYESVSGAGR
ncbi:glycosyltransferase [Arthrobacter sp. TMN-49]